MTSFATWTLNCDSHGKTRSPGCNWWFEPSAPEDGRTQAALLAEARKAGWKVGKTRRDEDFCPSCARDRA